MATIVNIPVEILEVILNKLDDTSLKNASKVCRHWLFLISEIARKRCKKANAALVEDFICGRTEFEQMYNWIQLVDVISIEKFIHQNYMRFDDSSKIILNMCPSNVVDVYGPWLLYVEGGCAYIVDTRFEETEIAKLEVAHIACCSINARFLTNLQVIVVQTSQGLLFCNSPTKESPAIKHLKTDQEQSIFPEAHSISAYREYVAVLDAGERDLHLLLINRTEDNNIVINYVHHVKTSKRILYMSLSYYNLLYVVRGCEFTRYDIKLREAKTSQLREIFHYEDKIHRIWNELIFSMKTASQMLEYWHMDRDMPPYMFGTPLTPMTPVSFGTRHCIADVSQCGNIMATAFELGSASINVLPENYDKMFAETRGAALTKADYLLFFKSHIKFIKVQTTEKGLRLYMFFVADPPRLEWVDLLTEPKEIPMFWEEYWIKLKSSFSTICKGKEGEQNSAKILYIPDLSVRQNNTIKSTHTKGIGHEQRQLTNN